MCTGCAAALEQGEGRFGGEHDVHERFRRGGNRHQHLRANSRRGPGTGQRQGCTNRVGITGKHGNDGPRSTCGVGRIGNGIDLPWLRHAGGTQRPVLSPLWLGPLTDKREVESRSPVVVSEDGSMSEKRDYYDVLGVEKSASAGDLKNAFRRLARKYHPDRSTEEDAEDRFKEIQEAYAVLSDEQKRAQYDRFGHNGPQGSPFGGGGFNINLEDILGGDFFSSFFGGGSRKCLGRF